MCSHKLATSSSFKENIHGKEGGGEAMRVRLQRRCRWKELNIRLSCSLPFTEKTAWHFTVCKHFSCRITHLILATSLGSKYSFILVIDWGWRERCVKDAMLGGPQ